MATARIQATNSSEDLAREIEALRDEVNKLKSSMADRGVEQTLEQIRAAADEVRKSTAGGVSTLRREVRALPIPSVLIAFGVGLLFGMLVSR